MSKGNLDKANMAYKENPDLNHKVVQDNCLSNSASTILVFCGE